MGNFNNLPTEILLDIITRLPTESILDCKLVCKPWRNLISHNPSFSQMHLTRLHDLDSGKLGFLIYHNNQQLHYFEYNEYNDQTPIYSTRINLIPPFRFKFSYYSVLGSVNGLVCLMGSQNGTANSYCICNPVTKEYVVFPLFHRDLDCIQYSYWASGFGFDSFTNEYKVVELLKVRSEPNVIEAAVYTLGSGNGWKNVGRFGTKFAEFYDYVGSGVFVNGALHWMDQRGGNVFVFDLIGEKFHEHVTPPPLPQEYVFSCYQILQSNTGCICHDIWLLKTKNDIPDMKEQEEHEPLDWRRWSKEFNLPEREPLALTKSGGLLGFDHCSIYIYDAIAATSEKLVDFTDVGQILPHKCTLISLKELGEEDIKMMESAEIEEP